jgi:hypothetical protein
MKKFLAFLTSALFLPSVSAQEAKSNADSTPALPSGYLRTEDWLKAAPGKLQAGEIDRLVNAELAKAKQKPSLLVTDEQFIRRVCLDITGKLPSPTEVSDFLKDPATDKRAKWIDKLLDSPEFARHWSVYWREVISSRTTDFRSQLIARHFERWLAEQFKDNKSWGAIVRDILTATGQVKYDEPDKNGQAYFLSTRSGADATTELAAEASRIFLGIQIQCAQCHDHPSDVWKREQFHQFAAYFARVRERPVRDGMRFVGSELVSLPFGEHQMPDKDNPQKKTTMAPKFLDGKSSGLKAGPGGFGGFGRGGFGKGGFGGGASDMARRKSLADSVIDKNNPWFAGAFVNRVWGELMGQSFYTPVDDMGPEKEAYLPVVLARVSAAFRSSDYDIKDLYRNILNSQTYQRQVRPGESASDHLLFAARNPTRLNAEAIYSSLTSVLGDLGSGPGGFRGFAGGAFGRFQNFTTLFKQEFRFDPSTKPEEVEGSVAQALLLMNSPTLNEKIRAKGNNFLARTLDAYTSDDEAVRQVYLRALARRPTQRELERCKEYILRAASRAEAYEDILWALINSTEFLTRQ